MALMEHRSSVYVHVHFNKFQNTKAQLIMGSDIGSGQCPATLTKHHIDKTNSALSFVKQKFHVVLYLLGVEN